MAVCSALLAFLAGCSWLPGCGCDEPKKPPPAPPPAVEAAPPPKEPAQAAPGLPTAPMPPAVTQAPLAPTPGAQPPPGQPLPPIALAPSPQPPPGPPSAAAAQRWGAQLGAFRSVANASTSWDKFKARYIDLLDTVPGPLLREVDLGPKGKFVRVMAGPFNKESEARSMCIEVLARGGFCYVQPLR